MRPAAVVCFTWPAIDCTYATSCQICCVGRCPPNDGMARRLVDEGARVVLLARDVEELARAREELLARGTGDVMTIRCDVRRRAEVRHAVDMATYEDPQRLAEGVSDVLVNGVAVQLDDKFTDQTPGRVLRKGPRK